MKSSIVIFEGTKEEGIFSSAKKFYPANYTEEKIFNEIKKSRIKLGKKYGFSGLKMIQPIQKMEDNGFYKDNKYVLIDEKYMKKKDYFEEKIYADILIITDKYKEVALCHRMGDCPVLIVEDRKNKITAIAHCNMYHINRELPKKMIEILINTFNCEAQNLYLYIGSHIHKENYIYDNYPPLATNKKVWEDAIIEKKEKYYIDLEKAIKNQLLEYNIAEIMVSRIDTAVDSRYASHRMAFMGNKDKLGQNIVGFYYK